MIHGGFYWNWRCLSLPLRLDLDPSDLSNCLLCEDLRAPEFHQRFGQGTSVRSVHGDCGKSPPRSVSSRRLARVSKRKTPNTEEAQPRPTAELRREGRLTRIAKALASGATVTEIAEAEGIGRTLASREANSPECRQLIRVRRREWEEMRAIFYRSMRAIEHALGPLTFTSAVLNVIACSAP